MSYTFHEHNKNMIIGVISGFLSGMFLIVYQQWADKGIWGIVIPIFMLMLSYIFIGLPSYFLLKRMDKRHERKSKIK